MYARKLISKRNNIYDAYCSGFINFTENNKKKIQAAIDSFKKNELLSVFSFAKIGTDIEYGYPNWMLDMIVAPSISIEALEILGKRKERKLYSNSALKEPHIDEAELSSRPIRGGRLEQPPNNFIFYR